MVLVNTSQYSDNSVMEHSYFCPKIRNPKKLVNSKVACMYFD